MSRREFVEFRGARWSVKIGGSGPVVLAVHGTGSSSHSFDPLVRHLGQVTLVAPDLPGHGQSTTIPSKGPALPAFAEGLAAVLERLGLVPEIAIGHSAGAAVLGWMGLEALAAPRLWVGIGAALVPMPPVRQRLAGLSARLLARQAPGLARIAGSPWVELLASATAAIPPKQQAAYRRLSADPDHVAGVLRMLSRWDVSALHDAIERVPGRWLLVAGEQDLAVPLRHQRAVARRFSDARLAVIPGGHLVHEANPAVVAGLIASER